MKKSLFTLCSLSAALFCLSTLSAAERTVWEGNEPISWNPEVYEGTQYETPANTFTGLAAGHIIKVSVVAKIDEPWYVMTYKAGEEWEWTDLTVTLSEGIMSYSVETDQIAMEIADRGLIFRGQGYDITKIVVDDNQGDDPDPEPEPEPQPGDEYVDQTVWTGDVAISWNPEVYVGTEMDTYNVQQDMLAGIAKDDSIKIYFAEAIAEAQFALSYKAGEEWTWTELAISKFNDFFAYKVASDEIAQDIADHGLVIRGQGYHATAIVIGKPDGGESAIENVNANAALKGIRFNILGQPVDDNYKGIVIFNGKKYIQR